MNKILLLFLSVCMIIFSVNGVNAEDCTSLSLFKKVYEKLLVEQTAVQEKITPLLEKMDTSTPDLIEQGTGYLRDFRKKMGDICQKMLETDQKKDCTVLPGETLVTNAHASCTEQAKYLLQVEQQKFEQNMLYDAGQKKFQFIVNKLQDINKKFRDLIVLFGMIKGEISKLFDNEGKDATKEHAGAGS